jgi:preprotein translocase subunit SecD
VETKYGYHIIKKTDERDLSDVMVRAVIVNMAHAGDLLDREPWIRTDLTGKQLDRAMLDFDPQTGAPIVTLGFDNEGAKLFAELTRKNVGKQIAIYLDGSPISIPTVQQEIPSGQAVISGSFTIDEAKLLAQRLQAGALPVPIEIVAQQSVGPVLGAQSVAASLRAGLLGFLLVILFMIVFYRIPGLVSVLALTFYAAFIFALFKLIPVTLSLSGIAGFILSIGMAVDANVLIFERLKEELKTDKPLLSSVDEAFARAWTSIRDGNATTLIVCFILYTFTSSLIKGFALTLGIGIIVSMFTAIVVTKTILKLLILTPAVRRTPWLFLK